MHDHILFFSSYERNWTKNWNKKTQDKAKKVHENEKEKIYQK